MKKSKQTPAERLANKIICCGNATGGLTVSVPFTGTVFFSSKNGVFSQSAKEWLEKERRALAKMIEREIAKG